MDFDVIIAGAGPAGSTCARLCAIEGVRTLLLERDLFPRPKPCGGALSLRGLSLLGLDLPRELVERECFGIRVRYRDRVVEARKDRPIAFMVDRGRFDHVLAEKAAEAGAVLRQEEPVQDISAAADRVEVRTPKGSYLARCVVGADGAYSLIGRAIRPLFSRDEIFAALAGSCPADGGEIARRSDGMLEFHFGVAPGGYGWVFPHQDHFGVGVMGRASEIDAPQKAFGAFAASVGMAVDRPHGHTIPMGGFERPVTGRRTLLVGDAAGFADPFHGEGMANAILSGKIAARAVADAIVRGRKDSLTWYQRECGRTIVREMRIALGMARMLARYPRVFLEIFFSTPEALDRYLDIPAGRSTYREFRKWLLKRLPGHLFSMLSRNSQERR